MARRRTRKGTRPATAAGVAKKASPRQRKLYGLNGAKVPHHERWRMELDDQYLAALEKDPAAAQWLSVFHEEVHRGVYQEGEPHVHTLEQVRELDRERKARAANQDVLSFEKYRGFSLEEVEDYYRRTLADQLHESVSGGDGDRTAEAWLFQHTGGRPEEEEDRRIDAIDRARSVALRKGTVN